VQLLVNEQYMKFTYMIHYSVQVVISSYVVYKATAYSKCTSNTFIHDMCDTFNIQFVCSDHRFNIGTHTC